MLISRFKSTTLSILALTGAVLLFTPRLNFVSIPGQTAGLRLDDLVLALVAFILFANFALTFRGVITLNNVEKYAFLFILASVASNIINISTHSRSNILYSVRIAEYFVFFYLGALYAERYKLQKLAWSLLWINGLVMILQTVGLIGGFASSGIVAHTSNRAIGLTGGPWEVGGLVNFCTAILVFEAKITTRRACYVFALSFFLIFLTAARMPMIANLVLLAVFLFRKSKHKSLAILQFSISIVALAAIVIMIPTHLSKRSTNLFSSENLDYLSQTYASTNINSTAPTFDTLTAPQDTDLSWLMRVFKWVYAAKTWISDPASWPLGVGPGTWGPALDGGWLRLLTENGIAGIILFWYMMRAARKDSLAMKAVLTCLFINMLMIDINIAYKAMAFVFFAAGYYRNLSNNSKDTLMPNEYNNHYSNV